jgi:hypothetical protein
MRWHNRVLVSSVVAAVTAGMGAVSGIGAAAQATGAGSAPGVVQDLKVLTKTTHSITLEWQPPSGSYDPISSYVVSYSADQGKTWTHESTPVTSYMLSGLTTGTGYEIDVTALNDAGFGPNEVVGGAVHLAAGPGFVCATDNVGVISCWGAETGGDLGDGRASENYSATPRQVAGIGPGATLVGGQNEYADPCAVTAPHNVECWGINERRNYDPTFIPKSNFPEYVDDTGDAVSASTGADCVLHTGGVVNCFNPSSTSSLTEPVNANLSGLGATQLVNDCVLTDQTRVACINYYGPQLTDLGLSDVAELEPGSGANCYILISGSMQCIGYDGLGQLGSGEIWNQWVGPTPVENLTDVVAADSESGSTCSVSADGTVDCWGEKIGSDEMLKLAAPHTSTPTPVTGLGPAVDVALSGPDSDSGVGTNRAYACAALTTGIIRCWGARDLDADGIYSRLTKGFYDLQQMLIYPAVAAGAPTKPEVVSHPDTDSVGLRWSAPSADGGRPITEYQTQFRAIGSTTWSTPQPQPGGAATTGTVADLTPGTTYQFRVEAWNGETWSAGSQPSPATLAAAAPAAPAVTAGTQTTESTTVEWTPPDDNGLPIEGYQVEQSTDGGQTWNLVAGSPVSAGTNEIEVPSPAPGRAVLVRVAAGNAFGLGAYSDPLTLTSAGTSTQNFVIQTPTGRPIVGGLVTWEATETKTKSPVAEATNDGGAISFPDVPPGAGTLSIKDGEMPNGTTVTGDWDITLGTSKQLLVVPSSPYVMTRTIDVALPDGVPIVGAVIDQTMLTTKVQTSTGFTYQSPVDDTSAATDEEGRAVIRGYPMSDDAMFQLLSPGVIEDPLVRVSYRNAEYDESKYVELLRPRATVHLPDLQHVTSSVKVVHAELGASVPVNVRIADSQPTGTGRSRAAHAGVSVRLVPPAGARASACTTHQRLHATAVAGHPVALRICASRSGVYTMTATGAAPAPGVDLFVRGAPPLAPTLADAESQQPGEAFAHWQVPTYSGGEPILRYRVVATSSGQRTRRLTTTSLGASLRNLHRFVVWRIRIAALTRAGTGDWTSTAVRVS